MVGCRTPFVLSALCRFSAPADLTVTYSGDESSGSFYIESTIGLEYNSDLQSNEFTVLNSDGVPQVVESVYCGDGQLEVYTAVMGDPSDWFSIEYQPGIIPLRRVNSTLVGPFKFYEILNTGHGKSMTPAAVARLDAVKSLIAKRKPPVTDLTPKK